MKFSIFILLCLYYVKITLGNYYEILGVSKSATDLDIKRAYKKLAREWHPDKNKNSDAQEKFMKINEAYEVLSNSQKRQEYDAFGSVSNEQMHARHHPGFEFFDNFGHSFFGNHESFNDGQFENVGYRSYKMNILPDSHKEPILMLVVSQMCFFCQRAFRFWRNVADQLRNTGIRITITDIMLDNRLQEEIKVHSVPKIILIIDGEIRYYQDSLVFDSLVNFVRNNFPRNLITDIKSASDLNVFHDSWMKDSRAKMILLKPLKIPSMRYLCAAFKYRNEVSAGFVNIDSTRDAVNIIKDEYDAKINKETLVLFHVEKNPSSLPKPVQVLIASKISLSDIDELLTNKHKYQIPLPRLTSQTVFDQICPSPSRQFSLQNSFCVLLLLDSNKISYNLTENPSWNQFYHMAKIYPNVPLAFFYANTQSNFLQSLNIVSNAQSGTLSSRVILLWRYSYDSAVVSLLHDTLSADSLNWILTNHYLLQDSPNELPESYGTFPSDSHKLEQLIDELEAPLWWRILFRLYQYIIYSIEFIKEFFEDPWTVLFTAITILSSYYLYVGFTNRIREAMRTESEEVRSQEMRQRNANIAIDNRIRQYSLTNDQYQLLLNSKTPGKLQAILFCTSTTPSDIPIGFLNSIQKLNSRTIQPFVMYLDKHPKWLSSILSNLHLPDPDIVASHEQATNLQSVTSILNRLSLNSTYSCEGNVIVTNMTKQYFFICPVNLVQYYYKNYHSSSTSTTSTSQSAASSPSSSSSSVYNPMLNDDDTDECDNSSIEIKLQDWLSQLLDGACRKFKVKQWPLHL